MRVQKNVNSLQNALAYFVFGFKTDSKSFIKLSEAWNQKLGGQLRLLLRDRGRLLLGVRSRTGSDQLPASQIQLVTMLSGKPY
jgi:hypothetical protein